MPEPQNPSDEAPVEDASKSAQARNWLRGVSLQWQICVLIGLAILLSLTITGVVIFAQSRDLISEASLASLSRDAQKAVDVLERELDDAKSEVRQVPEFPPIPGILRSKDAGGEDPQQKGSTTDVWIKRLGQILTAQMESDPERVVSALTDEQGKGVMRVARVGGGPQLQTENLGDSANDDAFQAARNLTTGNVYISPMRSVGGSKQPFVTIATPVFDEKGDFRGVFFVSLDGPALLEKAAKEIDVGQTDIVDQSGRYLFCESRPENAFSSRNYSEDMPVRAKLLTGGGGDEYRGFITSDDRNNGVALVAIYKKFYYAGEDDKSRFWAVAPSIPEIAALEPVRKLEWNFAILGLALLVVVGAATYFMARMLTRPIRRLTKSADLIAAGDLDAEMPQIDSLGEVGALAISIRSMQGGLRKSMIESEERRRRSNAILNSTADGIITLDEHAVISAMNTAAARIFGYQDGELVDRDASIIVPALKSDESEYDATPLAPGEVRSLGDEAEVVGRHKNGTEIPIALRVTQMEYSGERLFIATVQDVGERVRAREERSRVFAAIAEAVERLATTSSQIAATTTEQSASAQEQAASVTETATTIAEMTETSEQSSEIAREVAESARKADDVSHSGSQAVVSTIEAMEHVGEQVEATAENILALAERAQAIGEIITSVDDIADQTNLLALNAAIEASRAGEHGKGFAVVASEIKALAEQSKRSTDQVRQILGEIQQATNTAVLSTELGTKSVAEARAVVKDAETTINVLTETAGRAARSAEQIVASSNQQTSAMKQISHAMAEIDRATTHSLASTRQAEQAAADLNQLGIRLKELIDESERFDDGADGAGR